MATLDPKAYMVEFGGVNFTAFADDPNAFTVPDEHALFEVTEGADGDPTYNKNPMKGGPIGLLVKAGSKDYNQLAKWFQEIEDHMGSIAFITGSATPAGDAESDAGENDTYRPLASYSFIDCVLISGPKGPNRGTTEFAAGRFTFRANSIKRQSGGNSDDGLEEYPGLSGGGGAGGGGGEPGTPGFGQ